VSEQTNGAPLVEMHDIHKFFGTIHVLRGIDFHVDRREIVGLLGDNGAGKSTLIKILTGIHTPSSGQILFEDNPVQINSPHDARSIGIETVYQDLALVPLMSITRNFWLGQEITRRVGPVQVLDKTEMAIRTREALRDIGIHIRNADEPVGSLSGGERQSIAIGRAVYFGKKLLILDEPTSALSVGETAKVLEYTRTAKERGLSVIFITHNIGHVHKVADRFTIISHGQKVGDFTKAEVTELEVAQMVMTGEVPERLRLVPENGGD
jgi:simple sugar transport system ATP-binding protein